MLPRGIDFDEIGLILTGTPSEVASGDMIYTVSDSGSAQDISLGFELSVVGGFRSDDILSWLPIQQINLNLTEQGAVSSGQNPILDLDEWLNNPSGVDVEYSVTSSDLISADADNDENRLSIGVKVAGSIIRNTYTEYVILTAIAMIGGVSRQVVTEVDVNLIVST